MPAKSQAQRELLNAKFGHAWVKRHHFANKGKLPMHKSKRHKMEALLDYIIQFQQDPDDDQKKSSTLGTAATVAAGAGLGAGGLLAHGAIRKTGGYGANIMAMRSGGQDLLGQATGNVAKGTGAIGAALAPAYKAGTSAAQTIGGAASSIGGKIWNAAKKAFVPAAEAALSSRNKSIEFGSEIMNPWQGSTGHTSKIDQLEFPSGMSPAAALKFPFPKLMRYLNQRNMLQQVFSRKQERLIELNSKLDGVILFEDKDYKPRTGQRLILGNPLTTGIHGHPGFRYGGYKQAAARRTWETFKGASIGELGGMGIGAGIGALRGGAAGAEKGALIGGGIGGLGGTIAGNIKGTFGKKAKDVYRRYTGQNEL